MPSSLRINAAKFISKIKQPELYLLNRFIHSSKGERVDIENIISYVQDAPLNNISLQEIIIDHVIYFLPGISKSNISYYTFTPTKISIRFFDFPKPESSVHEWSKLIPDYYNFSDKLLNDLKDIINFHDEVFPSIKTHRAKTERLISDTEEINFWSEETLVEKIVTEVTIPSTLELISEFKPEIKKISLLNSNELLHDTFILDNNKFSLNVDLPKPKVRKLISHQITNDYPMMDYQNLHFTNVSTYAHELNIFEDKTDTVIAKNNTMNLLEENKFIDLKKYLEPVRELSIELMSEILFSFPNYQQEGAKFLFNSPFGFLKTDFELGKEIQSILALKMLLRIRAVKKVLIVISRFQEINNQWDDNSDFKNVWESNLTLLLNGFGNVFYNSTHDIFNEKEIYNNVFHCINYDTLEEAFIRGKLPHEKFNIFDCVILDDYSNDILKLDSIKTIIKNSRQNYFWILSDVYSSSIKPKIENAYKKSELNVLEIKKESYLFPEQHRFKYNYFLDIDDGTTANLEEVFERGRKTLDDLIQFGNLLRLQPNAFQIIQEMQRLGNFSRGSESPKAELLKYHLIKIFSQSDRVLIYSQFEKSGLSEITEILNELKYQHISFRQMDSQSDMDNKLDLCAKHKGKLVYLTNIKPNGIRFKFPKVSHLINFDNWWNPTTRWLLEEKLENDGQGITVFNYYLNRSPETRLFAELTKLGLFDKNIVDTISSDKFYNIYDDKYWGLFFGLSYDIFTPKINNNFTITNMIDLVNKSKLFLRTLGYNYITSQASINNNIFNLSGTINEGSKNINVTVKCIYSHHLNSELIKSIIFNIEEPGNKIFIITNGSVSHSNLVLPENISLIDGVQLNKYLELFKISA